MDLLDPTSESPLANLEFEAELLDNLAAKTEVFRLWESPLPIVVLGRSSKIEVEVNQSACSELGVPVFRRVSGGAAIVAGPGCLMYAVILDLERRPELALVDRAHAWVLGEFVKALRPLVPNVSCAGTSDLALLANDFGATDQARGADHSARKFSGNSLRKKRTRVLYHGTLLYDFDLSLIPRLLRSPPRQPDYRAGRAHGDFVTNLPLDGEILRKTLREHWGKI